MPATWTTPKDWVTGDIVLESDMDTYVTGNTQFLYEVFTGVQSTNVSFLGKFTADGAHNAFVVDNSNHNVGIGTLTPSSSYKLDVAGNARFQNDVTISGSLIYTPSGGGSSSTFQGLTVTTTLTVENDATIFPADPLPRLHMPYAGSDSTSDSAVIAFRRSTNTIASPSAISPEAGTQIGTFVGQGWMGGAWHDAAHIRFRSTDRGSTGDTTRVPGVLEFATTPDSGSDTGPVARMVIRQNGFTGFGTTTPAYFVEAVSDQYPMMRVGMASTAVISNWPSFTFGAYATGGGTTLYDYAIIQMQIVDSSASATRAGKLVFQVSSSGAPTDRLTLFNTKKITYFGESNYGVSMDGSSNPNATFDAGDFFIFERSNNQYDWTIGGNADVNKVFSIFSDGSIAAKPFAGTGVVTDLTGLVCIPGVNGAPSGTPAITPSSLTTPWRFPLVYDGANNKLYIYTRSGTWKSVTFT